MKLKTTKVSEVALKKARIYCVQKDIKLYEFVTEAINEKLKNEEK